MGGGWWVVGDEIRDGEEESEREREGRRGEKRIKIRQSATTAEGANGQQRSAG